MTLLPPTTMPQKQEISVREFRENLALYLYAAKVKKIRFVVMRHLEPIGEFGPTKRKKKTQKQLKHELLRDLAEARAQAEKGEGYTTEEARRILGIPPGGFSGNRKRSKK